MTDFCSSIEEELKSIADAEKQIRFLLSGIIQDFDNGINDDLDYSLALGLIESLNMHRCEHCIDHFVSIVSKHFTKSSSLERDQNQMLLIQSDSEEEIDGRKANRKLFYDLARRIKSMGNNQCEGHEYHPIMPVATVDKTVSDRCASACCFNWTHAFHLSSVVYTVATLIIPPCTALLLNVKNRAGSYGGDMANISNVIVIPTVGAYSIFQNWMNYDRTKAKKLANEIERRLANIDGVLEIAARVIGTMDNNISVKQARGYLKALIMIGWPDSAVREFMALASRQSTDFDSFIGSIKAAYKERDIPYEDQDIDAAFRRDSKEHVVDITL